MANVLPLYQTMLNDLIRKIESGELVEESKLPSESQLGSIYHVSRITVRRALAELESKQYIYKKQGQGSFVLKKDNEDLGIHYLNVKQVIKSMSAVPTMKLQQFQLVVDGSLPVIRQQLNLNVDDYLYDLQYMFYADGQPCFAEHVYLPYDRFPKIYLSEIRHNDLIPFLVKKYNLRDQFYTHTKAGLIDRSNRQLFGLNTGDPLIHVQTQGIEQTNDGRQATFYSEATVVGDLIMYIIG